MFGSDWFWLLSFRTVIYFKVPKDVGKIDLKNPQDMSYVFSGAYTPISCRLIEQVSYCLSKS